MTKARDLANASTALSAVSATELAFVDGVTSAIQTQMDAKAPSSTAVTLTGTQTLTNKTLTSPVISSVINNTLTSTTGDIIYASAANTPARLGIGTTDQVLKVTAGVPAWSTPAASGMTLITAQTFTASSTVNVNSVFSGTYQNYTVYFNSIAGGGGVQDFRMRVGGTDNSTASSYVIQKLDFANTTVSTSRATSSLFDNCFLVSAGNSANRINFYQPFETVRTYVEVSSSINGEECKLSFGVHTGDTSFDGFSLLFDGNNTGTVWVYGWKETV